MTTILHRCKWCIARIGKPSFKIEDEWTTLPSPVHLLGEEVMITDGLCPECETAWRKELEERKA